MKPLIVALDVDTQAEALGLVRATKEFVDIYKIGPTLVLRYGPKIIEKISKLKKQVFLDLKFHDIPNTMVRSIREAEQLGVYSATVHLSASEAALNTVMDVKPRPRVWGVTVLTSFSASDLEKIGIQCTPAEQVERLAQIAKKTKLDGVVASVEETAQLRRMLGAKTAIITPGIRLPDNEQDDQKRVATPARAREAGSTFIVVGRPIIESKTPDLVAEKMMQNWKSGR